MKKTEYKHPWITSNRKYLLTQPFFELTNFKKWNDEMGVFYKRVNETKDERSFVLLMTLIVEFHLDAVIRAFFPGHKEILDNKDLTMSMKIDLLKSLKLIPDTIFNFSDLIRLIRNEFAHNIYIDKIDQLNSYTKGKKLINKLYSYCDEYKDKIVYSNKQIDNLREKFKDIANFANNALQEYEPSVKLLRNEMENRKFIEGIIKDNKIKVHDFGYI